MTTSITMNQTISYNNLTPSQRLDIIKSVGTRTKTGRVKPFARLQRECFEYFVTNLYNN
jgi:hypothetical protein